MKTVAMIPLLLGSTRIPDKNMLLVDGYPLSYYVARACKVSGAFDEVYINSEHEVFRRIPEMVGVAFYRRSPEHGGSACTMRNKSRRCEGTRCQTHDHFLADFMRHVDCSHLVMVHSTSPLLRPETIHAFTRTLIDDGYDSLFSVEERYTETSYDGRPLNFSTSVKIPTQTLPPVQLITWALSGWRTAAFLESFERDDPEEQGPTFCGVTGFFPIDRVQALDADTWDELYMIEACLQFRRQGGQPGRFRLDERVTGIEADLQDLIRRDGVTRYEAAGANSTISNLAEIKSKMGPPPWIHLLVHSGTDQTGLICQSPGEGARRHYHVTHDEWWVVLDGTFEWRLEDGTVITARPNDVVYLPRGIVHSIVCTGEQPGVRLACGGHHMEHIYVR